MIPRFNSLSLSFRVLILAIALAALLILAITTVPTMVATTFERFSGFLAGGEPQQVSTQEDISTREGEYPSVVEDIRARSKAAFEDTDERFSRFDTLTSYDLEIMKTNSEDLKSYLDEVDNLDPPEQYEDHYELFRSAIADFYQAAELAYSLSSDPRSLTRSDLDEYHLYVDRANSSLKQSDELLSRENNLTGSSITTTEGITTA